MKSIVSFKKAATRVEDYLAAAGIQLKHAQALEVVARVEGAKSWNVLQSQAETSGDAEQSGQDLLAHIRKEADAAARGSNPGDFSARIASVHRSLKQHEDRVGDSAPCVQVEYDPEFFGGSYSSVGNTVAIPLNLVDLAGGSVETAFEAFTGLSSQNIVFYTLDEVVDAEGELATGSEVAVEPAALHPVMWLSKGRPMTEKELEAHTGNSERYIDVVVDVSWGLLGAIGDLNDEVSERITGSSVALVDIGYSNYFPSDEERRRYGEPDPRSVWIRVTAGWEPDTRFG